MHLGWRRLTATATAALATTVPFAGASAARAPIPHPLGEGAVVVRVTTTLNFWGGAYGDGHGITITGNGRVTIVPPGRGGRTRAGAPELVQADERALQKVLRRAQRIGLLGAQPLDAGESLVTDQGTTTIEVHAARIDRTIAVYALPLPEGDHGLTAKQRHARWALRTFVHDLTRPAYYHAGSA